MIEIERISRYFCQGESVNSVAINVVHHDKYQAWYDTQTPNVCQQLASQYFKSDADSLAIIVDGSGGMLKICVSVSKEEDFWQAGAWVKQLPEAVYHFNLIPEETQMRYALAWGLGAYQFARYKKPKPMQAKLLLPHSVDYQRLESMLTSIYWVRDLINTPAQDMMPTDMVAEAQKLAKLHKAKCKVLAGDKLLKANYPAVHAVGRGSK